MQQYHGFLEFHMRMQHTVISRGQHVHWWNRGGGCTASTSPVQQCKAYGAAARAVWQLFACMRTVITAMAAAQPCLSIRSLDQQGLHLVEHVCAGQEFGQGAIVDAVSPVPSVPIRLVSVLCGHHSTPCQTTGMPQPDSHILPACMGCSKI